MPSVYEQLEKAMDDAGASLVEGIDHAWPDDEVLSRARTYALARARFDGACAILREMEHDTITVTATTPPFNVKDYYPRWKSRRGCIVDDIEDDDYKAVD